MAYNFYRAGHWVETPERQAIRHPTVFTVRTKGDDT